jgi:hypothetical protein
MERRTTPSISGQRGCFRPSSTMRQPISCFSMSLATILWPSWVCLTRDFARRGVHGRQYLYWQCAEFHGLCHRAARRRENAWLLPLYDLVGRNSSSHLRSSHVAIRDVDHEELVALSNRTSDRSSAAFSKLPCGEKGSINYRI